MAELRKIRNFVKVVDRLKKKVEDTDPHYGKVGQYYRDGEPLTSDVKRLYTKPHKCSRLKSDREVDRVFKMAIEEGYVKEIASEIERIPVNVIHIEKPGRHIIERTMFNLLPRGLINAWTDKNDKSTNTVIGVVAGLSGIAFGVIGNIPNIIALMSPK